MLLAACSPYFIEDESEELGTTIDNVNYSNLELEILKNVNIKRNDANLRSLSTYNIVSSLAQEHTEFMLDEGKLISENKEERLSTIKQLVDATAVGEIISVSDKSADVIIENWMNNENGNGIILDEKYTQFGISIETDAEGMNYITFLFVSNKPVDITKVVT